MTKKKLTYLTILSACIVAGVFASIPSQAVSDEGKSKAMIMLEKAKAARLVTVNYSVLPLNTLI